MASSSVWEAVLELTMSAQEKNSDPLSWAVQLTSILNSGGVTLPSTEVASVLVSHICFDNDVAVTWKFLEKALSLNIAPPLLLLALLSSTVIPNRRLHPAAYRLYMELLKRHAFSFASLIHAPNYSNIMKSIDDVLHLSHLFPHHQISEPGLLLVQFVFTLVSQLLDASLDDERLLHLTLEKKSAWFTSCQAMELERNDNHEGLQKLNTIMAVELIGEFLQNKVTARILFLAGKNLPLHWRAFIQRVQLLAAHSAALRNSKLITPEILLPLISDTRRLLPKDCKKVTLQDFQAVMSSGSLISSAGQCHGASWSVLWLPIDLVLEDAMDGSQVPAISAVENLTGLVKALQAVNCTTWHDTFLGLWIASLRLVQREREPSEGPVPRIDTCLCMLLSITTLVVTNIIEEEEGELINESEKNPTNPMKEKQSPGKCHQGLITALQFLGEYDGLLTPPQSVTSVANQAAAKAMLFISAVNSGNTYYESISMNDMPSNCTGNMRHLIVESCIARKLLDTSAYFWPGYVNEHSNQIPRGVLGQVPGWSSLMKGSPLTPSMISTLVATPASRYAASCILFCLCIWVVL